MNQVQEKSGISKAIANALVNFRMLIEALSVNENVREQENIEKELEEVIKQEDSEKIAKLIKQTTSVHIPLENTRKIVAEAEVSEAKAQKVADEVKKEKIARRNENQKQIGKE